MAIFPFGVQVTFKDPEAAKKACEEAMPVINGRRANCNLASLGARRPKSAAVAAATPPPPPPPLPQQGRYTVIWKLRETCVTYENEISRSILLSSLMEQCYRQKLNLQSDMRNFFSGDFAKKRKISDMIKSELLSKQEKEMEFRILICICYASVVNCTLHLILCFFFFF